GSKTAGSAAPFTRIEAKCSPALNANCWTTKWMSGALRPKSAATNGEITTGDAWKRLKPLCALSTQPPIPRPPHEHDTQRADGGREHLSRGADSDGGGSRQGPYPRGHSQGVRPRRVRHGDKP